MLFVVFGTSAKEMNHNDIWHELMPLSFWWLCLGPRKPLHVLIQLVEVKSARAWGNWEMLRETTWNSYCELCQDVSRMYLLHPIVFHVWSSGTLLGLNVFKMTSGITGYVSADVWRSYVRSPSKPWFMWFRITGMWPFLRLLGLHEFPLLYLVCFWVIFLIF